MTYDALATTVEGNRPVELYRIIQGGTTWEFTSFRKNVTINSLTYTATAISRGRIEQSRESRTARMLIEVGSDNSFASRFGDSVPASRASLTIQRYQLGDGGTPQVVTIYEGFISGVSFKNDDTTAIIEAIPSTASENRLVPRFSYQNLCNNVLYDANCKVSDTDGRFRLSATASAYDSVTNVLTVTGASAFGSTWWQAGFVEVNGGDDTRLIISQSGDDLQLLLPFPTNIVGTTVVILAGCDHTIVGDCDLKFDTPEDTDSNVINYGGFAFVPTKNPFAGTVI